MNHWTGRKHKPETLIKLRLAKLGKKQSPETIAKRVVKLKGRVFTKEHRRKISESQKGKLSNNWKGDEATYNSIHHWIRDTYGRPTQCEFCKGHFSGRKIEWANKSGDYKRDRDDWLRLCARCHKAFEKTIEIKRLHSHK